MEGWFAGLSPGDIDGAAAAIEEGSCDRPHAWPDRAVEAGFVDDTGEYYTILSESARAAAKAGVHRHAESDDERVKQAIRALEDVDRVSNELAERVREWAIAANVDIDGIEELADGSRDRRIARLASIVVELRNERQELESEIERTMDVVSPNLTALAGPLLGARLIALAGDLESLAKLPSGTVQVLGAEDALFAHLHDGAPPPKHGIIYTHEYVRGTAPDRRGSAARALAGKLAIAARIDHYAGDYRPDLERELDTRIARVRGEAE